MLENQALQGSQALLGSKDQLGILIQGSLEQLACQDVWGLRDLKESLVHLVKKESQVFSVCPASLERRARGAKMGPQVHLAAGARHQSDVKQGYLVKWA